MGDRGNIVILEREAPPLFLYTHWGGSDLVRYAAAGLRRAPDRWNDPAYLARSVFVALLDGDDGTTGFGISTYPPDNEHPFLVLDSNQDAYECRPNGALSAQAFRGAKRLREWTFVVLAEEGA